MRGYIAGAVVIALFFAMAMQVKRDMRHMIEFSDRCLSTGGVTVVEYTRPQTPVCIPEDIFAGYKNVR